MPTAAGAQMIDGVHVWARDKGRVAQVECNFPSIAIHSGLQQEDA